ncbi:uncharacterized protein LOC119673904 isoform X1 [Teleopsis dalmanni]|uniref:uncharacterized protein LOC119673904 isoform X1 n=1 Tax=Teleopsis dalmanni TaxID=139649 RepID=UPI0018CD6E57|nr:uncharacterized protein LOC119673904 isoform X1 [Teleopsis dalmanni]
MMYTEQTDFIIELLNVYRSLPALWDVNSKDYKTLSVKNAQYDRLLLKFQEKYPNATKKCLSKKINILRTNYRREVKRMRELEKSGKKVDFTRANLYYFNAMDFLRDVKPLCSDNCINADQRMCKQQPQETVNITEYNLAPKKIKLLTPTKSYLNKSLNNDLSNSLIENFNESSIDDAEFITDDTPSGYAGSINEQTPQLEDSKVNINFNNKNIELITDIKSDLSKLSNDNLNNLPIDDLTESSFDDREFLLCTDSINEHAKTYKQQSYKTTSYSSTTEKIKKQSEPISPTATHFNKSSSDINSKIAEVWAHELSDMEERQKLLAKKLINDIIFNGHMGLLNYNTFLSNLNSILSPTSSLSSIYEETRRNSGQKSVQKRKCASNYRYHKYK